jgi:hypothetical protein
MVPWQALSAHEIARATAARGELEGLAGLTFKGGAESVRFLLI